MSPYVRTVKTASGATPVQVVWSNKHGKKDMDHIGSAHTLRIWSSSRRLPAADDCCQDELDLGDGTPAGGR